VLAGDKNKNENFNHLLLVLADNSSWYAEREERHKELVDETAEVGLMFASKAFVQLISNPFVGPLTHRYVAKLHLFAANSILKCPFLYLTTPFRIGYR
jgi:hypothetical protein